MGAEDKKTIEEKIDEIEEKIEELAPGRFSAMKEG